ncbi:MAG: hypothetical protein MRJ65_11950 [Candidatus Brocadiaceae bacterium]|nr:hypothetical protein [Candidatus Brocadiaceae bacterium]
MAKYRTEGFKIKESEIVTLRRIAESLNNPKDFQQQLDAIIVKVNDNFNTNQNDIKMLRSELKEKVCELEEKICVLETKVCDIFANAKFKHA